MKLAVMSDRPDLFGTVPDTFETSPCLLVWDTESASVCARSERQPPEVYAQRILAEDCEAVVTGAHIAKPAFETIADACVTRYNGAGLKVHDALRRAYLGTLELIREYEGGPGCQTGAGSCTDGHCAP